MSQHHTQYGDLPLYIGGKAYPSASEAWRTKTRRSGAQVIAERSAARTRRRRS